MSYNHNKITYDINFSLDTLAKCLGALRRLFDTWNMTGHVLNNYSVYEQLMGCLLSFDLSHSLSLDTLHQLYTSRSMIILAPRRPTFVFLGFTFTFLATVIVLIVIMDHSIVPFLGIYLYWHIYFLLQKVLSISFRARSIASLSKICCVTNIM